MGGWRITCIKTKPASRLSRRGEKGGLTCLTFELQRARQNIMENALDRNGSDPTFECLFIN